MMTNVSTEIPEIVTMFVDTLRLEFAKRNTTMTPRADLWRSYKAYCLTMGVKPAHGPVDFYDFALRELQLRSTEPAAVRYHRRAGYDYLVGVYIGNLQVIA